MNRRAAALAVWLLAAAPATQAADDGKYWVEPMRQVHARFKGTPGTLAQFGDSITISLAYWAGLENLPKNATPEAAQAHQLVKQYMKPACWRDWRGPKYGSEGGMTIRWAHQNIDKWLKDHNPETATIMFGTNDLNGLGAKEYEQKLREVIEKCLKNGTVMLVTTIPPRHGFEEKSEQFAEIDRKVARDLKCPVIDYQAEILKRRTDDWDGTGPKFKDVKETYEVPTLISKDGVHPSNPRRFQDFSKESLNSNGFLLRGYLTMRAYADVIREVLQLSKK